MARWPDVDDWEITADYLGGDPRHPARYEGGRLRSTRETGLRYDTLQVEGLASTPRRVALLNLPAGDIEAISIGDTNHMRALTRAAAGSMLAGSIGGLIGMVTGRRNTIVLVRARIEEAPASIAFATELENAQALLNHHQADRHARGEDPLPTIEEHVTSTVDSRTDRQTDLLREIRDLLIEQNQLIRRSLGS